MNCKIQVKLKYINHINWNVYVQIAYRNNFKSILKDYDRRDTFPFLIVGMHIQECI